jgi:hypothetical protein
MNRQKLPTIAFAVLGDIMQNVALKNEADGIKDVIIMPK